MSFLAFLAAAAGDRLAAADGGDGVLSTTNRWSGAPLLAPGVWVRHPQMPDWGLGQVQSIVGERITVNFEHRGKVLINGARVTLEIVDESKLD